MSRWIDSNLADRLYMVQKRINFPVPMIHKCFVEHGVCPIKGCGVVAFQCFVTDSLQ